MNLQEAFSAIVVALHKQGKKSQTRHSQLESELKCMYRENHTAACPIRCGIGHIIPDDKYTPAMEFYPASCTLISYLFPEIPAATLEHMQMRLHDSLPAIEGDRRDFRRELLLSAQRFARAHRLAMPVISEETA